MMNSEYRATKPLGGPAYGSIGHLPGSRLGPADRHIHAGQERICLARARDSRDRIIVQEKLDGSCVAAYRPTDEEAARHPEYGRVWPLIRAGYHAMDARYQMHLLWWAWVLRNEERFLDVLRPGERAVGEWLAQAHGTRYVLPHEPWVGFDIGRPSSRKGRPLEREPAAVVRSRLGAAGFVTPRELWQGPALPIKRAVSLLDRREPDDHGTPYHGAEPYPEGVVYRVERNDLRAPAETRWYVDFLAKWVRPGKIDGEFLSEENPVWNDGEWDREELFREAQVLVARRRADARIAGGNDAQVLG